MFFPQVLFSYSRLCASVLFSRGRGSGVLTAYERLLPRLTAMIQASGGAAISVVGQRRSNVNILHNSSPLSLQDIRWEEFFDDLRDSNRFIISPFEKNLRDVVRLKRIINSWMRDVGITNKHESFYIIVENEGTLMCLKLFFNRHIKLLKLYKEEIYEARMQFRCGIALILMGIVTLFLLFKLNICRRYSLVVFLLYLLLAIVLIAASVYGMIYQTSSLILKMDKSFEKLTSSIVMEDYVID